MAVGKDGLDGIASIRWRQWHLSQLSFFKFNVPQISPRVTTSHSLASGTRAPHRRRAHKRVSMDSYPAHKLLTGREITRHRLRGLQASKELQRLNRRTSEGLMSTESLSSILQKFDLNGDGDDRKMAKEFVSALRSLNAAPAAGQRSMSALSSPDIRSIIQTISSPEKRPGHAPDAKSPDAKSKGAVDYHRLSRCRSYGDASDGVQVPKSLRQP